MLWGKKGLHKGRDWGAKRMCYIFLKMRHPGKAAQWTVGNYRARGEEISHTRRCVDRDYMQKTSEVEAMYISY